MTALTLKERRKALGLTQVQLARRLRCHVLTWQYWETLPTRRLDAAWEHAPQAPAWLEQALRKVEADPHARLPKQHFKRISGLPIGSRNTKRRQNGRSARI